MRTLSKVVYILLAHLHFSCGILLALHLAFYCSFRSVLDPAHHTKLLCLFYSTLPEEYTLHLARANSSIKVIQFAAAAERNR